MINRINTSLQLTALAFSKVYVPVLLLVGIGGVLALVNDQIVPQVLEILPPEKWPAIAQTIYLILN